MVSEAIATKRGARFSWLNYALYIDENAALTLSSSCQFAPS